MVIVKRVDEKKSEDIDKVSTEQLVEHFNID